MEVTDKDLEDTLKAAGVSPKVLKDIQEGIDPDVQDTLRQAGVPLSAVHAPVLKKEKLPEPAPERLPPASQAEAERQSQKLGVATPLATGIPMLGAIPRIAGAATGAAGVGGTMPGDTFSERFGKNFDVLGEAENLYAQRHPIWSPAGEMIGATAATLPLAATRLGSMALGGRGPSVAWRGLGGAAGGASVNALDAALRGEDPVSAAEVGGAGGLAGPLLGEGARGATRFASDQFWPRPGPLKGMSPMAISKLTGAVEGETPASIAAARNRAGPSGMLADLNTATTDIAGGLADIPGQHKGEVREAYRQRDLGAKKRISDALDTYITPKTNVEDFKDTLIEARKAAADPLYDQWRSTKIQPTDKLKELVPRLEKAGAFKMAQELADVSGDKIDTTFFTSGDRKNWPTAQTWDLAKRGLDRRIEAAYASGDKTLARELVKLRGETLKEIEAAPGGLIYKQARQEFADRSSILDQIDAGKDTFLGGRSGVDVDQLRNELKGLSGPELQARLVGLRKAADEVFGATAIGDTSLRNKILAPNNQEKIKLLLGEERGQKLIDSMEQEKFLKEQSQNVVGGSQTTPKKERTQALQPLPGAGWDLDIARPGSWLPPPFRPSAMADAMRGARTGTAMNQLGGLITTPEGPQLNHLLAAIQQEANRRAMADRVAQAGGNSLSMLFAPATATARRRYFPTQ